VSALAVPVLGAVLMTGVAGCSEAPSSPHPNGTDPAASTSPAATVIDVESDVGAERTDAYRELTLRAVLQVESLWGQGSVARPVRLVLPGNAAAFADATGVKDPAEVPAAVVGSGVAARLVVHPDAWDRLSPEGRLAVLTHEVTHLAQQGDGPVPWWLGEGLAEYTAHRASALPVAEVAASALDGVRAGRLPATWPAPDAAEDRWNGYAMAWLACRYLADTHSERSLVELYRAVSGGQDVAVAIPEVLGVPEEEALAGWRRWLTELAAD
jgi:hypothetical protein